MAKARADIKPSSPNTAQVVLGLLGFRHAGTVNWTDNLFFALSRLFALAVIAMTILLVVELLQGAEEAIRKFGLGFLVGTVWDPVTEEFSTLPTVIGTLVISFVALLMAIPVSLGTAVFIALYAPAWLRSPLSYLVEMLAAIPSVIYGLWGLFVLVPVIRMSQMWLKSHFGWFFLFSGPANYGTGVLAAGVMLAIMITPIITAISRDVIRAVPRSQVEAMYALGATKWEAVWNVVLPYARGGIIGAAILGLGRAIGETMAVTMVGGNAFRFVTSLFDPVHSMASQIASEFSEATYSLYVSSLVYVGLVLFVITIVVNLLGQLLIWRVSKGRTTVLE